MFIYAAGMVVIVGIISAFFLSFTVLRPVRRLMQGAQAISSGKLDHRILIQAKNELGKLAEAFNEMTTSLGYEKEENRRWAETLQQRIRDKTEELNAIHRQILHIEKMASLGRLSATVAHELNNPLEAILTYAKLIARRIRKQDVTQALASENLEDIELIARETERCGTIVKNLLLFSKKQIGEFGLISVREIIEKATQLIRHHCEISNVQVESEYPDGEATILCDENQIQQALVALFVNAVEAMPEGGKLTVALGVSASDGEVTVSVTDTGVGIAGEDMPHIFEPFFSTKKDMNGVGLGLSVVYGIVERHGGKISVTSEVGRGTTFTLKFPRVADGPHQAPAADQHTAEGHL
jgi:two-component system NtrC family sensor kinase